MATPKPTAHDRQSQIMSRSLRGALRGLMRRPDELRYHVIRETWSAIKRFGADRIENIEIREIVGAEDAVVETYLDDPNRGVIATVCRVAEAGTFFEIGTNRGRTAWTVARNNPTVQVYTLDLPHKDAVDSAVFALNESDLNFFRADWDRGDAYRDTAEAERIETLLGDSATFDYTPYHGRMDVVLVDGAHSYEYVRSDTEHALKMLSEPRHDPVGRLSRFARCLPTPHRYRAGARRAAVPHHRHPPRDVHTTADRQTPDCRGAQQAARGGVASPRTSHSATTQVLGIAGGTIKNMTIWRQKYVMESTMNRAFLCSS